jgi:hypothetical protein
MEGVAQSLLFIFEYHRDADVAEDLSSEPTINRSWMKSQKLVVAE